MPRGLRRHRVEIYQADDIEKWPQFLTISIDKSKAQRSQSADLKVFSTSTPTSLSIRGKGKAPRVEYELCATVRTTNNSPEHNHFVAAVRDNNNKWWMCDSHAHNNGATEVPMQALEATNSTRTIIAYYRKKASCTKPTSPVLSDDNHRASPDARVPTEQSPQRSTSSRTMTVDDSPGTQHQPGSGVRGSGFSILSWFMQKNPSPMGNLSSRTNDVSTKDEGGDSVRTGRSSTVSSGPSSTSPGPDQAISGRRLSSEMDNNDVNNVPTSTEDNPQSVSNFISMVLDDH